MRVFLKEDQKTVPCDFEAVAIRFDLTLESTLRFHDRVEELQEWCKKGYKLFIEVEFAIDKLGDFSLEEGSEFSSYLRAIAIFNESVLQPLLTSSSDQLCGLILHRFESAALAKGCLGFLIALLHQFEGGLTPYLLVDGWDLEPNLHFFQWVKSMKPFSLGLKTPLSENYLNASGAFGWQRSSGYGLFTSECDLPSRQKQQEIRSALILPSETCPSLPSFFDREPLRVLTVEELSESMAHLDTIYVFQGALTPTLERLLLGFEAALGKVVVLNS